MARSNLIYEGTFEGASPFTGIVPQSCTSSEITASTDHARTGTKSAKIICNKSDCDIGTSRRSEMNRSSSSESGGVIERWYGVSFYLPSASWAYDTAPEIVIQWHEYSGSASPYFALWVQSNKWNFAYQGVPAVDLGTIAKDTWTDYVFHMKWNTASTGLLEVWKNGVKVITRPGQNMPILDTHGPYLKTGIYKWYWKKYPTLSQTTQRIIYIDELRIGNEKATYNDVVPGDGTGTTTTSTTRPTTTTTTHATTTTTSTSTTTTTTHAPTTTTTTTSTSTTTTTTIFSYRPVANAGANRTKYLPSTSTHLYGSGTDRDGTIVSHVWTKVSGPSGGNIKNPLAYETEVINLVAGTYTYRLSVTDNRGLVGTDTMQVIVLKKYFYS